MSPLPTDATILRDGYHTKLHNGAVNVKAFGALGDGTTDDSAAILAAVSAATLLGGSWSGAVLFPAGIYRYNSATDIVPEKGMSFIGLGQLGSTIKFTSTGGFRFSHNTDHNLFRDLYFWNSGSTCTLFTWVDGVSGCATSAWINCTLDASGSTTSRCINTGSNANMVFCRFIGTDFIAHNLATVSPISITSVSNSNANLWQSCVFQANGGLASNVPFVFLDNTNAGGYMYQNNFRDIYFEGCTAGGIKMLSHSNCTIDGAISYDPVLTTTGNLITLGKHASLKSQFISVNNIAHLGAWAANTYLLDSTDAQFVSIQNIDNEAIRVGTRQSLIGVTTAATVTGTPAFKQTYQGFTEGPYRPLTKLGAPVDADFETPLDGMTAYDQLLGRSYVRIAGAWKQITATTPTFNDISSLGGCVMWMDFNDLTTLYKDTALTIPATTNGDVILGIVDKSGAGANLLSSSGTGGVYTTGAQNGQAVLRCTTATGAYKNSLPARPTGTYYFVFQKRSAVAGSEGLMGFNTSGNAQLVTGQGGGNVTNYNVKQAGGVNSIGYTPTVWHVGVMKVSSASSMTFYVDGASTVTIDPNDVITTGTGFEINNATGIGVGADFDFGEILVYNSAHSDGNRNTVEAALKAKWGTP